jgi:uncharacterized protein (DUF1778 family)
MALCSLTAARLAGAAWSGNSRGHHATRALLPLKCPVECRTVFREGQHPMPNEQTRTARIEARISPEMLAVVKRAAEIQGRSLSDFVVTAAQEAAQRTIEDTALLRLSVEDQRLMMDAILNPPEPNAALRRAAEAHRRLIAGS